MTTRRTRRSNGGRRAKAAGHQGEANAKKWLLANGWYIADSEIQGLAGDDYFAWCPINDKWYSVEVKNVNTFNAPKYVGQAKAQAVTRDLKIKEVLSNGHPKEIAKLEHEKVDTFVKEDWIIMWHPKCCGARADEWTILFLRDGNTMVTDYASWERMMNE